jgi:hypothetical protein
MNVQVTHADGTITCPCAVSKTHSVASPTQSFIYSRGLAPARAASLHLARPSPLPLSDPPRNSLLRRPPARYLYPFLPRIQLTHRLRGA